jgi:3-isopropylmalate dehydrogenase
VSHRIVTLPGDGIGPEIMAPVLEVLRAVGDFEFEEHPFGGASIDAHGAALTDETLAACRAADAVLLAAVGGPKWDSTDPHAPRPEQGLLGLRKGLGLYANLRPVKPQPALYDASPLKRELIEGTDLLVVRELTGGIYFGEKTRTADSASDVCAYTTAEIERIARVAFQTAIARSSARVTTEEQARQGRREHGVLPIGDQMRSPIGRRATEDTESRRSSVVTSVDKANVLETSRLWREVVAGLHSREFPHIQLEHVLVDNAAMQLVAAPRHFDVILTENMFGDILSDEAAMLTGSIGMLPSASLGRPPAPARQTGTGGGVAGEDQMHPTGTSRAPGLFEPVHGSAPDIAGKGIANPLAMILSAALMLRHGLGLAGEAAAVESAVDGALAAGLRTPDLGGSATTAQATRTVLEHL